MPPTQWGEDHNGILPSQWHTTWDYSKWDLKHCRWGGRDPLQSDASQAELKRCLLHS